MSSIILDVWYIIIILMRSEAFQPPDNPAGDVSSLVFIPGQKQPVVLEHVNFRRQRAKTRRWNSRLSFVSPEPV